MADVKNVMGVSADDIKSIMGVAVDDIKTIVGLDWPASGLAWGGTRSVIFGGNGATQYGGKLDTTDYILYKTLASDSNTSTFGQMVTDRDIAKGSGSNVARAVVGGGNKVASETTTYGIEEIDYITVGSTGNGTDFGNLVDSAGQGGFDGASNGTLCFFNGGWDGTRNDDMEYITIASTGNGTDAGNLEAATNGHSTSHGDSKYLIMGGYLGSGYPIDTVSENNFHTTNGATDYGSVGVVGMNKAAVACSTARVVCAGGYTALDAWTRGDQIHYFPIASSADSTDAGNLHTPMFDACGTSDGTRGEFYGGEHVDGVVHNEIQKITIASVGDATDVGDLTSPDFGATTYNDAGGVHGSSAQTGT